MRSRNLISWLIACIIVIGATLYTRNIMVNANPSLETSFSFVMLVELFILAMFTLLLFARR